MKTQKTMKLSELGKALSREELITITAGTIPPDCETGEVMSYGECVPAASVSGSETNGVFDDCINGWP